MVSFRDLRDAEPGAYDDIADQWARLASELDGLARDVKRAAGGLDGWSGEAAEAARDHIGHVRSGYATAAEHIERIPPILRSLSDSVRDAQERINGAVETAETNNHVHVDRETGEVSTPPGNAPGDMRTDEQLAQDRTLVQDLADTISTAVADAADADSAASQQLRELQRSQAGLELAAVGSDQTVSPSDVPSRGDTPEAVNEWWNDLTPVQQEAAIYTHGDRIGKLDGIPSEARDRANRLRFEEEFADVTARRNELLALGDERSGHEQQKLYELNSTHTRLEDIRKRIDPDSNEDAPDSYLLDYDTEGAGRAIIATGNPDTADNTVTTVPGTGSGLDSLNGELDRTDSILERARQEAPSSETAAVTWIGYEAPDNEFLDAPRTSYAEDAAPDLAGFQSGLNAAHHDGGGHTTLVGHSYGSTVIGHAASNHSLNVDNMILLGSPGVGVDHASELGSDADVYATTAENDIIRAGAQVSHGMGTSPIDEDFGAIEFQSDPGSEGMFGGMSIAAHSEYWHPHNESLENMALIITGRSDSKLTTPDQ